MQVRKIVSLFCLTFFLHTLTIASTSADGGKEKTAHKTNSFQEKPRPPEQQKPEVRRGFTERFRRMCAGAGIEARNCLRLVTECFIPDTETETESAASENQHLEERDVTSASSQQTPASPEEVITQAHQRVCTLTSAGAVTLAREDIENTLSGLSGQRMKLAELNHEVQLSFLSLVRIWSQFPYVRSEPTDALKIVERWLLEWGDDIWLEYGSDILVDLLSYFYAFLNSDTEDLPDYRDAWLMRALKNIPSTEAQEAVKFMVRAAGADEGKQEPLLRKAILTGYSHPLPYLMLIDHFVSMGRYREASHICAMYSLVVQYNRRWDSESRATSEMGYWHKQEMRRLEKIYQHSFENVKEDTSRQRSLLSYEGWLSTSLESWPDDTRERAEDIFFTKALEVPNYEYIYVLVFLNAILERSLERWLHSGKLPEMADRLDAYMKERGNRGFTVSRVNHAIMLTRLDRELEAANELYDAAIRYEAEYEVALQLVAAAHKLHHQGYAVVIPSYGEALKLGRVITASGNRKALGERLSRVREGAEEAGDLDILIQLLESAPLELGQLLDLIPQELTQLNPAGRRQTEDMGFSVWRMIQEEKNKGSYSGDVPSPAEAHAVYAKMMSLGLELNSAAAQADSDYVAGLYLEELTLLENAAGQADSDGVAGAYLETLTRLEKMPLSRESMALQWKSMSRWLAEHDKSIEPVNTLEDALKLTPDNELYQKRMYSALSSMRYYRYLIRSAADAREVAIGFYKGYMEEAEKRTRRNKPEIIQRFLRRASASAGPILNGYSLHWVADDGLCLYHALTTVYNVDETELIYKMFKYLRGVYHRIQYNLENNREPLEGLTDTEIQAIAPIVFTPFSGDEPQLDELHLQVESLLAALSLNLVGTSQGTASWGSLSLMNTAAVVLNEQFNLNGSVFALVDEGNGPVIYEFYPDGQQSTHGNTQALGGEPMLVLDNGSHHWLFASAEPSGQEGTVQYAGGNITNTGTTQGFEIPIRLPIDLESIESSFSQ